MKTMRERGRKVPASVVRLQIRPISLLVLFLAVHLTADLAMPSLPGAFRFNPDESVVGVPVEPIQAEGLGPAPSGDSSWEALGLSDLGVGSPPGIQQATSAPVPAVILPRRDTSSDRPPDSVGEDD